MATLREYFDTEARDMLNQLERQLRQTPQPDAGELHRTARALRGTAQMAREDRVFRVAFAFEAVARALAGNVLSWSEDIAERARDTIADLRALIDHAGDDADLDARVDTSTDRWRATGVHMPARFGTATAPPVAEESASREFRHFVAREVAAIADALEEGVRQLANEPMDREPLKMILRRQRALLGAARLDETPVIAEILRAIEDLTRVIAKLDVGVKQEWLDIYRVAGEGLKAGIEPLQRDEDPQPSHALSRLRHMREELLERYGTGEAVSAAHESAGFVQATALDEPPAPPDLVPADVPGGPEAIGAEDAGVTDPTDTADPTDTTAPTDTTEPAATTEPAGAADQPAEPAASATTEPPVSAPSAGAEPRASGEVADTGVLPIEELCYRGDAALQRALELRGALERVAAHDPSARAAVDELFDLIRLART